MLIGSYDHTLDAKGRIFIPAKFRDELGSQVVLTNSLDNKCIYLFSMEQWEQFSAKFTSLPLSNKDVQKITRQMYSYATEREPDKQGRVLLSPEQKELAGIKDDVKIIGMTNKVEIWSKDRWEEYSKVDFDEMDDDVLDALAQLGI